MQTETVTLINKRGLHARAASKLVDLCKGFSSEIHIHMAEQRVDAKSIMALLMLGAPVGTELTIEAQGDDETAASAALVDLIERGFDEIEEDLA